MRRSTFSNGRSNAGSGAVRIKSAPASCRTELHVVDGELPGINYPIVPGHEAVGRVDALGFGVTAVKIGGGGGGPMGWLHIRRVSLFQAWPRKSIRPAAVHRPHPRRRLRHRHGRASRRIAPSSHREANEMLLELRFGQINGAAVLQP